MTLSEHHCLSDAVAYIGASLYRMIKDIFLAGFGNLVVHSIFVVQEELAACLAFKERFAMKSLDKLFNCGLLGGRATSASAFFKKWCF